MIWSLILARDLSVAAGICSRLPSQSCQIDTAIGCNYCSVGSLGCLPFECPSTGTSSNLYKLTGSFGQDNCMLTETAVCTDCLDCDVDCRKNVFKHNLCSFQFLNQTSQSSDNTLSSSSTWDKYKYVVISIILAFVLIIVILMAFRAKRSKTEVVKKYHTSYAGLFKINSKDRDIVGKKADDIVQTINAMEGSKKRDDSAVLHMPSDHPAVLTIDQPIVQKQDFRHLEIQQVQDQQVQFEEGSVIESMVGSLHDGGSSVADGSIRRGSVQNYDRGFYKDGVNLVRPRMSTMREDKVSSITSDDSFILNNVKFERDHR